jgi:hypothetical protein
MPLHLVRMMTKPILAAAIASIVLALASAAHAQVPGPVPEATPSPLTSYRLEILAIDAAALAGGLVADEMGNRRGIDAAIGLYVVGPSLVHAWHRQPGRAVGTLALRVGLPLVFGLIGDLANENCSGDQCVDNPEPGRAGLVMGALIGAAVASAIDIGYAREDRATPAALPPPPPPSQPLASPDRHEVRVSLAFRF